MKSNHFKMRWLCLLFALFTLNIQARLLGIQVATQIYPSLFYN